MDNPQLSQTTEVASLKVVGLDAAIVGDAAHDTVLRFSGAPVFTGQNAAGYFVYASDAVNGTFVRMLRRGKYLVKASIVGIGGAGVTGVRASISLDATAPNLALDPVPTIAQVLDSGISGKAAGDITFHTVSVSAVVEITQVMINAAAGVVRIQASNGANASPGAAAFGADCTFRIVWIGEEQGGN